MIRISEADSEKTLRFQGADLPSVPDDDVVQHLDVEDLPCLPQDAGDV